jgi:hypothetical protein
MKNAASVLVNIRGKGGNESNIEGIMGNDAEDDDNRKPAAKPMGVDDGGKEGGKETRINPEFENVYLESLDKESALQISLNETVKNNVVIEEGSAEAVADGGRDNNVFGGDDNNSGQGKDRVTLTDGAKDPGGNTGANGSSVDDTNEIVIEEGIAEAVADGGRNDNVFEGDDSNLGQGKDWAMLTDGAKDAGANAGGDGSLVDNIETTLTDGANNPDGNTGANNRSVKGMDKIVDKMEMTLTDDCAMSTSGDEGAKESPVNDMDEIGLIFKFEDIETKVCLKEFGSYVKFNNKCLHRG